MILDAKIDRFDTLPRLAPSCISFCSHIIRAPLRRAINISKTSTLPHIPLYSVAANSTSLISTHSRASGRATTHHPRLQFTSHCCFSLFNLALTRAARCVCQTTTNHGAEEQYHKAPDFISFYHTLVPQLLLPTLLLLPSQLIIGRSVFGHRCNRSPTNYSSTPLHPPYRMPHTALDPPPAA